MEGLDEYFLFEDTYEKRKEKARNRRNDISSLSKEEQENQAFERIMRIASKREVSSEKMVTKLKPLGYSDEAIGAAIERAVSISAINDRRYCECLVRTTLSMGRGLRQVEREIRSLGIDPEELDSYREYMAEGQQHQVQAALKVLLSHPPHSKNVRNSAYRKLISRGFCPSVASEAVSAFCSDASEEQVY